MYGGCGNSLDGDQEEAAKKQRGGLSNNIQYMSVLDLRTLRWTECKTTSDPEENLLPRDDFASAFDQ